MIAIPPFASAFAPALVKARRHCHFRRRRPQHFRRHYPRIALALAVAIACKMHVTSEDETAAGAANDGVPSQEDILQCCDCCPRVVVAMSRSAEEGIYNLVSIPTTSNMIITIAGRIPGTITRTSLATMSSNSAPARNHRSATSNPAIATNPNGAVVQRLDALEQHLHGVEQRVAAFERSLVEVSYSLKTLSETLMTFSVSRIRRTLHGIVGAGAAAGDGIGSPP